MSYYSVYQVERMLDQIETESAVEGRGRLFEMLDRMDQDRDSTDRFVPMDQEEMIPHHAWCAIADTPVDPSGDLAEGKQGDDWLESLMVKCWPTAASQDS